MVAFRFPTTAPASHLARLRFHCAAWVRKRPLVLIDGRRVAPYPVGAGGTLAFIDLRSIPEAAIESIEILKDGASTTYGADAVAGVVNIKLRHDYKGAETSVEYGNTLDKDSGEVPGVSSVWRWRRKYEHYWCDQLL